MTERDFEQDLYQWQQLKGSVARPYLPGAETTAVQLQPGERLIVKRAAGGKMPAVGTEIVWNGEPEVQRMVAAGFLWPVSHAKAWQAFQEHRKFIQALEPALVQYSDTHKARQQAEQLLVAAQAQLLNAQERLSAAQAAEIQARAAWHSLLD